MKVLSGFHIILVGVFLTGEQLKFKQVLFLLVIPNWTQSSTTNNNSTGAELSEILLLHSFVASQRLQLYFGLSNKAQQS